MKKYIRALICITYSFVKFSILKILKFDKFKFGIINLVSPWTEIEVDQNGKLFLGNRIKIRSGSKIRVRKNSYIAIGENTSLNHGCIFTAHEQIIIGNNVQFGPNVLIYDHDHDFRCKDGLKELKYKTSAVQIGDNVWIGANTIILRGTKIGNNCVVGAGSVIKGEYPDDMMIVQKKKTIVDKISREEK